MADTAPDPALVRLVQLAIFAACAVALGTAYVAQYVFGLEPCILCLYQRVPYVVAGTVAMFALFLPTDSRLTRPLIVVAGLLFLANTTIAAYHVGVEQHWWASVASCGGGPITELTTEDLLAQLSGPPPKACDEPAFVLFGVSMAGYNALASLIFGALTLCAARRLFTGAAR